MRLRAWTLLGTAVLSGASCGDTSSTEGSVFHRTTLVAPIGPDDDLSEPPLGELTFQLTAPVNRREHGSRPPVSTWDELNHIPLFAGAQARVTVTAQRFPRCGVTGQVQFFMRTDDRQVHEYLMETGNGAWGATALVTVPDHTTQIETWVRASTEDGCVEYDSNLGRNYWFPVYRWQPTRLTFGADWTERADGPLVAGTVVVIDFDPARLSQCRTEHLGFPSWNIFASANFSGQVSLTQALITFDYNSVDAGTPATWIVHRALFAIPRHANRAQFWFENASFPEACRAWDSDFGRNYHFPVQPAAGF